MKNTYVALLAIALLIVGSIGGAILFPTEVIKEVEKTVEVPIEVPAQCTLADCPIPEPVDCPVVSDPILDKAVADFMQAVEDEEDEAGNSVDALNGYDFDEISISKVYDEYSIDVDGDKTKVSFSIRLKYKEKGEKSEKIVYDVVVNYEEDEDTEVEIV